MMKVKTLPLTQSAYEKMGKYALVLGHGESCPNCISCKNILHEGEYNNFIEGIEYYELDFTEQEELADEFNIQIVPHLMFFVNKKIKYQMWGLQEPFTIYSWLQAIYNKETK